MSMSPEEKLHKPVATCTEKALFDKLGGKIYSSVLANSNTPQIRCKGKRIIYIYISLDIKLIL